MSSGVIGHHPGRVEDLGRRARMAVEDLAGIVSDDPAAAVAIGEVRRAREHLESDWLPLLERIRTSDAMTAPIVAAFSDDEREFFQGFVDEQAPQVAAELCLFDAHPDYAVDALPSELRQLDDRNEWMWLATLYLIEQYHHMIDTGTVELQRDGDAYWIDPIDLTDTNSVITGEIILAASPLPAARTIGITEAESPVWPSLTPYRGKLRSNGKQGRDKRLYTWDHTHRDIEVFDRNGKHLGSMDPVTGAMISRPSGGVLRMTDFLPHACDQMVMAIDEPALPVRYFAKFRAYSLIYSNEAYGYQLIEFCRSAAPACRRRCATSGSTGSTSSASTLSRPRSPPRCATTAGGSKRTERGGREPASILHDRPV